MLKIKGNRVEPTEYDIYKFAPVFAKGVTSGVYLRYYQHREKVLTGNDVPGMRITTNVFSCDWFVYCGICAII